MSSDESDLARRRLHALRLGGPPLSGPEEVVRWLVGVQAQEVRQGTWSIGMRAGVDAAAVDRALADGRIVRTHVLRPTWHFVLADDLRWLLDLTGPRILARNAHRHRRLGLDERTLGRATEVIALALGEGPRMRGALRDALEAAGIETGVERLAHIVMHAELTGAICSGPPEDRRHTYALLGEGGRRPGPEEALAELVARYLASHGPATAKDLRWWASLTAADVAEGLKLAGARRETVGDRTFWSVDRPPPHAVADAHLVPTYDELLVGYTESRDLLAPEGASLPADGRGVVVIGERAAGRWKARPGEGVVTVDVAPFGPLAGARLGALRRAVDRYGAFLNDDVSLRITPA